jgi:hypothetical protein
VPRTGDAIEVGSGGTRVGRGKIPNQCRVVCAGQLVREGGQREVRRANDEISLDTVSKELL